MNENEFWIKLWGRAFIFTSVLILAIWSYNVIDRTASGRTVTNCTTTTVH